MSLEDDKSNQSLTEIYDYLASKRTATLVELLEEQCKKHGVSQRQLSQIIGVQRKSLQRILEGEAQKVDVLTLLKINQFLGLELNEVIKHYVSGIPSDSVNELEASRKSAYIVKHFDLEGLKKSGFIKSLIDFNEIEQRILEFFGLDNIYEYDSEISGALFSRTKKSTHDKMMEFWVKSAYLQFQKVENPNEYDRDSLLELISKMRPYTRQVERGLTTVVKALFNIGITVIIQSYLTKTQIRGGTFIVNGKPCIVLTDFNKRYDTLWFTLLHELCHVLFDLETIETTTYHLTGEPDIFLIEEEADQFARDYLLTPEKLAIVQPFIFSEGVVKEYAQRWKIHESIIYGMYLHENENYYPKFRSYITKSDQAVKNLKLSSWDEDSIVEHAKKIKEVLTSK
jgi:Zn-dependent peptidase ImmA (M78 family)/transcriptional regulator with XRE-family HTH domain